MKLSMASLAVGSLLLASGLAGNAATITVTVPSGTAATGNFIDPGVTSNAGKFLATLTPTPYTPGFYTPGVDPSIPTSFNGASVVSYGTTQIVRVGGAGTDTFSTVADFSFDVTTNGKTNSFFVVGHVSGSVGGAHSQAFFTADSISVDGGMPIVDVSKIPVGNRKALETPNVNFNGALLNVFVEQTNNLTAPDSSTFLTVGGYVPAGRTRTGSDDPDCRVWRNRQPVPVPSPSQSLDSLSLPEPWRFSPGLF